MQWVRRVQVGSRWRMVWRMVGQLGGSGVVRQPCDMVGGCFYWWGVGLLGWGFVVLVVCFVGGDELMLGAESGVGGV